MRRKIFVGILVSIMLMVPLTTVAKTTYMNNEKPSITATVEMPRFFIEPDDRIELDSFIESEFDEEDQDDAYDVTQDIISEDDEIDIIDLAFNLNYYGYPMIPQVELDAVITKSDLNLLLDQYWNVKNSVLLENLFGSLIELIFQFIQNRLGWVHNFLEDGSTLFVDGVKLVIKYIQLPILILTAFVGVVNQILQIPKQIYYMLTDLFEGDFDEVFETITNITNSFAAYIADSIDQILPYLEDFSDVEAYLLDFKEFILWLDDEPWKHPIHVTGVAWYNGQQLAGATVRCRGTTTTTDSNGEFDFYVSPNPDGDSIPPNKWYGFHDCTIIIEKDGEEVKRSIDLLSYVFSEGELYWIFFIIVSKAKSIRHNILERVNAIVEAIINFFPDLLRKLLRTDILAY